MRKGYYIHRNVKWEFDLYEKDSRGLLDYLETFPTLKAAVDKVEELKEEAFKVVN